MQTKMKIEYLLKNMPVTSAKEITSVNYEAFTFPIEKFSEIEIIDSLGNLNSERYYRKNILLPTVETTPYNVQLGRAIGNMMVNKFGLDEKTLIVEKPDANRIVLPPIKKADGKYLIVRLPHVWQRTQDCKKNPATKDLLNKNPTIEDFLKNTYVIDGTYGIIVTSDKKIVCERRSEKVANNPGGLSLMAGGCGFWEHPLHNLENELIEELNLSKKDYNLINENPLAITFAPSSLSVNYVYLVETSLNFENLRKNAENAKDRWEWAELVPVKADAKSVRDFAINHMTGKGSKVALLAYADYLEGK